MDSPREASLESMLMQQSTARLLRIHELEAEVAALKERLEAAEAVVDGLCHVGYLNDAGEYCSLARYEAYQSGSDDDCAGFTTLVFVRTYTQHEIDAAKAKAAAYAALARGGT